MFLSWVSLFASMTRVSNSAPIKNKDDHRFHGYHGLGAVAARAACVLGYKGWPSLSSPAAACVRLQQQPRRNDRHHEAHRDMANQESRKWDLRDGISPQRTRTAERVPHNTRFTQIRHSGVVVIPSSFDIRASAFQIIRVIRAIRGVLFSFVELSQIPWLSSGISSKSCSITCT